MWVLGLFCAMDPYGVYCVAYGYFSEECFKIHFIYIYIYIIDHKWTHYIEINKAVKNTFVI